MGPDKIKVPWTNEGKWLGKVYGSAIKNFQPRDLNEEKYSKIRGFGVPSGPVAPRGEVLDRERHSRKPRISFRDWRLLASLKSSQP